MPYSKCAHTLRTAGGNTSAARAHLGTEFFVDDDCFRSVRNRFVSDHIAKHRPACVTDAFCHLGFFQSGWADITNCDKSIVSGNLGALDVQEVSALPSDLRCQLPSLSFLVAPLVEREFFRRGAEEARVLYLVAVAQRSKRLQAKVNTDSGAYLSFSVWQFDLGVNKPMAVVVTSHAPRLRCSVSWNFSGQPQLVSSPAESQHISDQPRRALEVRERNPIQIALGRPKARRLRKTRSTAVRKLCADRINRVGMDAEFLGRSPAQSGEIEARGALYAHPCSIARCGSSIRFATEIPDEIHGASLRTERATSGFISVFDPEAVSEYHLEGRLSGNAETRLRDRVTLPTSSVPTKLPPICLNIKGAAFLPGLNAGVFSRNIR